MGGSFWGPAAYLTDSVRPPPMLCPALLAVSGRSFTPTAHSPASHRLRSHLPSFLPGLGFPDVAIPPLDLEKKVLTLSHRITCKVRLP